MSNDAHLLPCPACGATSHTLDQYLEPTGSRCDDHYMRYQCGRDCGYQGPSACLNSIGWDEDETEQVAAQAWNDAVREAEAARAVNQAEVNRSPALTEWERELSKFLTRLSQGESDDPQIVAEADRLVQGLPSLRALITAHKDKTNV